MGYHEPVLLQESVEALNVKPDGIYVDVTFGGGGHSRAIIEKLAPGKGKLIAFDRDPDAQINTINDTRFLLITDNFSNMKEHLQRLGRVPVNGIIADLGVSSHQFDTADRGFSTRFEHTLDMRMDPVTKETALDILNTRSEPELQRIFSSYGEIHNARTLASAIVRERTREPFRTASSLKQAISGLIPAKTQAQYMAKFYQALRIEVNNELDALKTLLRDGVKVLADKGRMVIISYHSLEDRLVKNFFQKGNFDGKDEKDLYGNPTGLLYHPVLRKPVSPSDEEIMRNPRSRSARMRAAEKI